MRRSAPGQGQGEAWLSEKLPLGVHMLDSRECCSETKFAGAIEYDIDDIVQIRSTTSGAFGNKISSVVLIMFPTATYCS